jgi:hypothetical protein
MLLAAAISRDRSFTITFHNEHEEAHRAYFATTGTHYSPVILADELAGSYPTQD